MSNPKTSTTWNPSSNALGRRRFLNYLIGGSLGATALGLLRPNASFSRSVDIETLCSAYPNNSRCQDYLPGVQALDMSGVPIAVDTFLPTLPPGEPVPVKGLSDPELTYLIIEQGPEIAPYALQPICTHLGCVVPWNAEQNRFICPCHGSQYDPAGRVVQGPASRALPLVKVVVRQNQIRLVDRPPSIDPR